MSYNLHDYTVKILHDKEDGDFIAVLDEIPTCSAFGDTPEAALKELEFAFEGCLKAAIDNDIPFPAPFTREEPLEDFSGKFSVRLPRSLHRNLVKQAKMENVSLNQEILHLLSFALGIKKRVG